jgi:1,4-alpha-glucan branching enzyme
MNKSEQRTLQGTRNGETTLDIRNDTSLLTADDLFLFNQGTHYRLYEKLGAHCIKMQGVEGTYFAVWAPMPNTFSLWVNSMGGTRCSCP